MVVPYKSNCNLLLGRDWIYGVGIVPFSLHQRISIWMEYGTVENVEADQSYYMAEVNHVSRKTFDKNLENIASCPPKDEGFISYDNIFHSVRLHPTHGFM